MPDILIRGMEMPESCFDCPIFDNFCQERCGVTGTLVYGEIDPQREKLPDCPLRPAKSVSGKVRVRNETVSYMPKEVIEHYVREEIAHNLTEFMIREDVLNIQMNEDPELQERIYSVTMDIETKRNPTVRGPAEGGNADGNP